MNSSISLMLSTKKEIAIPVILCILLALIVFLLTMHEHGMFILLGLLGFFVLLLITVNYPEVIFGLFLTAGHYKADPRLQFIPASLDITIALGVLSILGILYGISTGRIKTVRLPTRILLPYFTIVLVGIISLTYTEAPIYGTEKLLRFTTITSLALYLPLLLFQKEKAISKFFTIFIVLASLMVVDTVSKGIEPGDIAFITAFGSNYLALGGTTGFTLIIIVFYFLLQQKNKLSKLCYIALVPLMIFGLFISGGRGPLLEISVSLLLSFAYIAMAVGKNLTLAIRLEKSYIKYLMLISFLIIISALLVVSYSDYFSTVFQRLELLQDGGGHSALTRVSMLKKATEAISRIPEGIWGLGIGGFSVYYAGLDQKRGIYPHNLFLELGSELGFLGLIAITLMVIWGFSAAFLNIRNAKPNQIPLSVTLLTLLTFSLVNALISGDLNDHKLLFTWIGLINAAGGLINAKT